VPVSAARESALFRGPAVWLDSARVVLSEEWRQDAKMLPSQYWPNEFRQTAGWDEPYTTAFAKGSRQPIRPNRTTHSLQRASQMCLYASERLVQSFSRCHEAPAPSASLLRPVVTVEFAGRSFHCSATCAPAPSGYTYAHILAAGPQPLIV
jgi:hypothetical protein